MCELCILEYFQEIQWHHKQPSLWCKPSHQCPRLVINFFCLFFRSANSSEHCLVFEWRVISFDILHCFLFISFGIFISTWNLQATLCSQLGRTSQATPRLGSRFKILKSDRICFFFAIYHFSKYSRALKLFLSILFSDPASPAVLLLPSLLPKDSAALAT